MSYRRWEANERALRLDEPLPTGAPLLLAAGIAVVGVIVDRGARGRCPLLSDRAWRASAPGSHGSAARSASSTLAAVVLSVAAHREAPGLLVVSAALVGRRRRGLAPGRRAYAHTEVQPQPRRAGASSPSPLRWPRWSPRSSSSCASEQEGSPDSAECRQPHPRMPVASRPAAPMRCHAAAMPDTTPRPRRALIAPRAPPRWWSASSSASSPSACSPSAAFCCGPTARRTSRATSHRHPALRHAHGGHRHREPRPRQRGPRLAHEPRPLRPHAPRGLLRATTSRSSSASRAPRTSRPTCAARPTPR